MAGMRTWGGALGLALLAACSRGSGRPHVSGTMRTDEAVERWSKADLKPADFKEVDPAQYRAAFCEQGSVQGVDALVCEYKEDDALDGATRLLHAQWAKEGVGTAAAVRSGRTLLAVADRKRADPYGKTINKMVATFKKP